MSEQSKGAPVVSPPNSVEKKGITAEAAKEASRRALDRLKGTIVASLEQKLNTPLFQSGEIGKTIALFKQVLIDPSVTNVGLVQVILQKEYPTLVIDRQLGPRTLGAMLDFVESLPDKVRGGTDTPYIRSGVMLGDKLTRGSANGNDKLVHDPKLIDRVAKIAAHAPSKDRIDDK